MSSRDALVGRLGAAGPVVRVGVAAGRIVAIDDEDPAHPGAGRLVRPGLVDLQVNGVGAHDLTADPTAVWRVGSALAREGVTAFLPTLVSPAPDVVTRAVEVLAAGPPGGWRGARPLGWHVEGPFLAPSRRGAHPEGAIRPVDLDEVAGWAAPQVRLVTLAPEVDGALEAVATLVDNGVVVAAGHSDADEGAARSAFDAGVAMVTHWGNAMAPWHHRAPGLAGAALADDRVVLGVIADGHHLAPTALAVLHRAAGERVVLVSDRIAVDAGQLAGGPVEVVDGAVRTPEGRLAGAAAGLCEDVVSWQRATRDPADAAWAAASTRPAAVLGEDSAAGVEVGAPADLVVADEAGRVRTTVVGGVVVHVA